MPPFSPPLLSLLRPSLLRTMHRAAGHALRKAGYRWEPRRSGELRLGVWRKTWRRTPATKRSGPPSRIALIPGFGDTPLSWTMVLTLLNPTLRKSFDELILFDFPGFAGFLSHERPYHSIDLLKGTLFGALDSLQPQTIIGHSLGGWLGSLYAAQCGAGTRPERKQAGTKSPYLGPDRLLLVNASGLFECEADRDELERKFRNAIAAKENSIEVLRPHLFAREPVWFRAIAPELSRFFQTAEIEQFIGSFRDEHMLEHYLDKTGCAVWLINGELDTLIPPKCVPLWLRKLNAERPIARAITLKGAGHSPQIEAPAVLAAVLNQILSAELGADPKYLDLPIARRWWELIEPSSG